MSEPRTDWTSAKQRQFTRENIARYPDAPFPYSAVLDLLDALDAALAATTPALDVDRLRGVIRDVHVTPAGHGLLAGIDPYEAFLRGVDRTKGALLAALSTGDET